MVAKRKNKMETCPYCGKRSRDPKCIVCRTCDCERIQPIKDEADRENIQALLEERPDDLVNAWEKIFAFVLAKGKETIAEKQSRQTELIGLREAKRNEIPRKAEVTVLNIIASYHKGGNSKAYEVAKRSQQFMISALVDKLTKEFEKSKIFMEAYGVGKSITSLRQHLEGIELKCQEHKQRVMEEKKVTAPDENDVLEVVQV